MQFAPRKATASAMTTLALLTVAACERPMEPTAAGFKPTVNLATAVADADVPRITLSERDASGAFLLNRACDVFIGEPAVDPADGAPQRYAHQLIVELPPDAGPNPVIKLVGDADMQASGSKVFTCDADDPDIEGLQPVIDPITDHAAKGDGPTVTTNGVTLDLNGYSITVSPAFGTPYQVQNADGTITSGTFENLGIVLAGSNQTLTNSADVGAEVDAATGRNVGVSYIWAFGHNVDVEAESPTVRGRIVNGVYNLESNGGFGIRLSSGTMTIDAVKSVNNDDLDAGGGFEARRISSGFLTVSNSHFEGGAEGAFLREVSGVTFTGNYVASVAGPAIVTRQARSLSGRPVVITNNTVGAGTTGILWGRESTSSGNLKIEGNVLLNAGCSIGLSSRNALSTLSPYSLTTTALNYIGNFNYRDAAKTVKATHCRVGD